MFRVQTGIFHIDKFYLPNKSHGFYVYFLSSYLLGVYNRAEWEKNIIYLCRLVIEV